MSSPPAEAHVDAVLIGALLRDQFPALGGRVRIVANGWDNVIARVGDDLCVRLPRRALSAPLVQHEADWLPTLARTLPVDVPVPIAVGAPGHGYPWTWLVCPWFPGRPLTDLAVGDRSGIAGRLGGFVAALHRPAPAAAPRSPWRGIGLGELEPTVAGRLQRLSPEAATILAAQWDRCRDAAPHPGPPSWLHGDLHPFNVLADVDAPTLRAVIDWGDLCCGDPATDLAVAWLGFDEIGRAAFRAALADVHPPDDPVWDRALAWSIALGMLFLLDTEPGSALRGVGEHLLGQLRPETPRS